jgi:hypothetical protein
MDARDHRDALTIRVRIVADRIDYRFAKRDRDLAASPPRSPADRCEADTSGTSVKPSGEG